VTEEAREDRRSTRQLRLAWRDDMLFGEPCRYVVSSLRRGATIDHAHLGGSARHSSGLCVTTRTSSPRSRLDREKAGDRTGGREIDGEVGSSRRASAGQAHARASATRVVRHRRARFGGRWDQPIVTGRRGRGCPSPLCRAYGDRDVMDRRHHHVRRPWNSGKQMRNGHTKRSTIADSASRDGHQSSLRHRR